MRGRVILLCTLAVVTLASCGAPRPTAPANANRATNADRATNAPGGETAAMPGRSSEGFLLTSDGIRLYYQVAGVQAPDARTLIIPFATLFADGDFAPLESRFRVIYYDMRGRGRSDSVDAFALSFDAEIDDIEAVRSAFGADRVSLLGVSMLGSTCLHYALRYPDRVDRVVAVNPLPPRALPYMRQLDTPRSSGRVPQQALARIDELVAEQLPVRDPIAFAAEYNAILIPYSCAIPADKAPEWARFPTRIPNEWAGNASIACGSLIDTLGLWDWRDEFAEVERPVLVVYGTEDYNPSSDAARELAGSLANAELAVLDGAGHFAHVAARDAFFEAVETFLAPE